MNVSCFCTVQVIFTVWKQTQKKKVSFFFLFLFEKYYNCFAKQKAHTFTMVVNQSFFHETDVLLHFAITTNGLNMNVKILIVSFVVHYHLNCHVNWYVFEKKISVVHHNINKNNGTQTNCKVNAIKNTLSKIIMPIIIECG